MSVRDRICLLGRSAALAVALLLFAAGPVCHGQTLPPSPPASNLQQRLEDGILDRMDKQESLLQTRMRDLTPRIETYMQIVRLDPHLGNIPVGDRYYLGHLRFNHPNQSVSFLDQPPSRWRQWIGPIDDAVMRPLVRTFSLDIFRSSFVHMIFPDTGRFDRQHYRFIYVRREFLGHVRCYVFDVAPFRTSQHGRFFGRIWIEDQDDNLVRFNGTFWQNRVNHPNIHFDSWRVNVSPGWWVPAYVYTEESSLEYGFIHHARLQAQTRLWGYDLKYAGGQEELTDLRVEGAQEIGPPARAHMLSPLDSQRSWESEAEENVLDRLERAGLLAPPGQVDQVLDTVVNNLIITNHLQIVPAVHCRVLLTTPLESLTIGHAIVLSRGLIDTLPDETSLAAMLAHELAHIALGHQIDTAYAFGDRMLFADQDSFYWLDLRRTPEEEQAANQAAIRYLLHSPYKNQLERAGLYLRQLQARYEVETQLFSPHLGDAFFVRDYLGRLSALEQKAPPLKPQDKQQVAALPLGSRILVDPWTDQLHLQQNPTPVLLSAREKMPLQVTPFFPYLVRAGESDVRPPTAEPAINKGVPGSSGTAGTPGVSGTPALAQAPPDPK